MTIEFKNGVPTFFEQAPTICLRDPLAAFLGAAEGGLMTYSYQDAVKLAGHSCPTVAGSFIAVIRGLKAQRCLQAQQRKLVLPAWVWLNVFLAEIY